jgi:hypothetical protein
MAAHERLHRRSTKVACLTSRPDLLLSALNSHCVMLSPDTRSSKPRVFVVDDEAAVWLAANAAPFWRTDAML